LAIQSRWCSVIASKTWPTGSAGRGDLLEDFSEHLESLQETCAAVTDTMARRYFPHVAPVTWTAELTP